MEEPESPRRRSSQWYDIRRRFVRNRMAVVGLAMVVVLFLVAIFAPLIAPYSITERTSGSARQSPSLDHLFGTDSIGRDVFSRVVFGARVSLRIGILATAISLTIGLLRLGKGLLLALEFQRGAREGRLREGP